VVAAALLVVAFSVCLSWVWTTLALLMKSPGVVLTAVIAPLAMRLLRTR
jgi:ABC-2 type transport system permease protein